MILIFLSLGTLLRCENTVLCYTILFPMKPSVLDAWEHHIRCLVSYQYYFTISLHVELFDYHALFWKGQVYMYISCHSQGTVLESLLGRKGKRRFPNNLKILFALLQLLNLTSLIDTNRLPVPMCYFHQ